MLPHAILRHQNFVALSPYAIKLLIDLYMNFNGKNNGDFCATWSLMKKRGWRSEATLNNALKELMYYGWIVCTRQGGKHRASLYAVTFRAIDECGGKLDTPETATAPANWKEEKKQPWKQWIKNKKSSRNVEHITTRHEVNKEQDQSQAA